MRFTKLMLGLMVMASMLVVGSLFADERGTPGEAEALVDKAAAHLTAVGAEKAFAGLQQSDGPAMSTATCSCSSIRSTERSCPPAPTPPCSAAMPRR